VSAYDLTLYQDSIETFNGQAVGAGSFVGACIYLASGTDLVFSGPEVLPIPFDRTSVNVGGVADLANNQLVIPSGKGGVWAYGFGIFTGPTVATTFRAALTPSGAALNLIDGSDIDSAADIRVQGVSIDVFSEGDTLTMTLQADAACTLPNETAGDPWRMYAYHLGPSA
jgi:hypothetical protein